VALALRRKGIVQVRPLAGGLSGWRAGGFPVEPLAPSPRLTPDQGSGTLSQSQGDEHA